MAITHPAHHTFLLPDRQEALWSLENKSHQKQFCLNYNQHVELRALKLCFLPVPTQLVKSIVSNAMAKHKTHLNILHFLCYAQNCICVHPEFNAFSEKLQFKLDIRKYIYFRGVSKLLIGRV